MLIFRRITDVRPDLCSGIPQPHRVDISCIDESVRVAVAVFAEVHGSVKRIRETVAEHPREFRIRKLRRDIVYHAFYFL